MHTFLQLVIEVVSIQRNQFSIEEGKNTKEKTTNYAPLLIMQYQSKDISYWKKAVTNSFVLNQRRLFEKTFLISTT